MPKKIVLPPILLTLFILFYVGSTAANQQQAPTLPPTPFEYANLPLPPYFTEGLIAGNDTTPANNPITNEGATLGRVLFYDTLLSANDTVSCSSCHEQAKGFSDSAVLSTGFNGELTSRHSMSLNNPRYYKNQRFFWDERAATLEEQALLPIQDSVEMGLTLTELETKLAATPYYADLFTDAFGTPDITSERVSFALAQFMRSMVSYQSRFDDGVAQNFQNFTPLENQGRAIFEGHGKCIQCHETNIQILELPLNNGLDATTIDPGTGGAHFKVGSLRNVALSAPYMHDGRFATLAEVVEFYNSGVQPHPNLDIRLRISGEGRPRQLELSQQEKDALVAFLHTLTDQQFITAERFSNPFTTVPTAVGMGAVSAESNTPSPYATSIIALSTITIIIYNLRPQKPAKRVQ